MTKNREWEKKLEYKLAHYAYTDEIITFISEVEDKAYLKGLQEAKEIAGNIPRHLVERHITDTTIVGAVTLEDLNVAIDEVIKKHE